MKRVVNRLNARFAPQNRGADVVVYEEVPRLSINERVALWLVADVFLLTSIREGLNLLPLEYIYARKDLPHAGVVVASEFTCCSTMLSGSQKVCPSHANQLSWVLINMFGFFGGGCSTDKPVLHPACGRHHVLLPHHANR